MWLKKKTFRSIKKKYINKLKDQNKSEIIMIPLMFQRNAVFF